MTKQEFISMSLPHDLCIVFKEDSGRITGLDFFNEEIYILYKKRYEIAMPLQDVVPIIRPFSDLYKECVQSDYNDGKPFIPIVELAMIASENKSAPWVITKDMTCVYNDRYKDEFRLYDGFFHVISDNYRNSFTYIPPQFELFQQLIKWHFWHNMKEDEQVIYVTEEFNPYK